MFIHYSMVTGLNRSTIKPKKYIYQNLENMLRMLKYMLNTQHIIQIHMSTSTTQTDIC